MKKFAFTLAEVLITLAIVGIIAAMTLPTLIDKFTEMVIVNRLKQTYSILSQAYLKAQNDNGSLAVWDIGSADTQQGSIKLYDYFRPYFTGVKDCKIDKGCFAEHYKALFSDSYSWQPDSFTYYAKGVLANGTPFLFWSRGTGCPHNWCGTVYVDVNGLKGPNVAGIDLFIFVISTASIVPIYYKDKDPYWGPGEICRYNNKSGVNGIACTGWVIKKGNLDYLHRDVYNEMDNIHYENFDN